MGYIEWAKDMLENKQAQELLESKIEKLVTAYFDAEDDEYAIEKLIKAFGEGLRFEENYLLKERGIHRSQIKDNMMKMSMNPQETARKFKEVENLMLSSIERQYRHFNTFLSAVKLVTTYDIISKMKKHSAKESK